MIASSRAMDRAFGAGGAAQEAVAVSDGGRGGAATLAISAGGFLLLQSGKTDIECSVCWSGQALATTWCLRSRSTCNGRESSEV